MSSEETQIIKFTRKYWQAIVLIASILVAWTNLQSTIQQLNKQMDEYRIEINSVKVKIEVQDSNQQQIQVQLSQIQTDLSWIKEKLAKEKYE